jgi:hypothetical protein
VPHGNKFRWLPSDTESQNEKLMVGQRIENSLITRLIDSNHFLIAIRSN